MKLTQEDYNRIYREICEDRQTVEYHIQKNKKKLNYELRRKHSLPVWYCERISLPKSGNEYLIYYYAASKAEVDADQCFAGAPLMMEDGTAMLLRKMTIRIQDCKCDCTGLKIYSRHFFDRYKQRMNLPEHMPMDEVVATYFGRNGGYAVNLSYKDMVLEKNRWKGNSAWAVEDGVALSEIMPISDDVMVFQHNTFLSRKDLKENQKDATPLPTEMRNLCLKHFNL